MKRKNIGTYASLALLPAFLLAGLALGIQDEIEAQANLSALRKSPATLQFSSIGNCLSRGFEQVACERSSRQADHAGGVLPAIKSAEECARYQFDCQPRQSATDDGLGNRTASTYYIVDRSGWQVLPDDLNVVAPLWKGKQPGTAVRIDGKEYAIP